MPSKALLRAAHAAHAARDAARFGVSVGDVTPDFPAIMERLRQIRADIGPHDSAERLRRDGIDVFLGQARFTGPDTLEVNGTPLRFRRACIATGARPVLPPIPGIEQVGAITNQHLFTLTELPSRLTVVGAGVIGCEMAQAFARLGSTVTLIDLADRVLAREEAEAAALVQEQLVADGITLKLGVGVERFERSEARVTVLSSGERVESDVILVAAGRRPNLDLDLEAAGVQTTKRGIQVDSHLVTTNPNIYAAGDVIGQAAFTHAADFHARIVIRNALFFGHARVEDLIIPRVTFTQPEVAAVGITGPEADETPGLTAFRVGMDETDRGRTDSEAGYCRIWADSKGRIHGAVVVAEHAGELLAPITLAMTQGVTLGQIANTIHPYPTRSEVVFKVASAYNRTRVTPTVKKASTWLLDWRR